MSYLIQAAQVIHTNWRDDQVVDSFEPDYCPQTPEQGYEVQAALADIRDEPVVGWKIAATAQAGRDHINVDRPLAGRLYESIVSADGDTINMGAHRMAVAEAEIVLMVGSDLPPRPTPYSEQDVAAAINSLHPGLELPDSRFSDFTRVGAACLIADNACARHFVLGPATQLPFNAAALADLKTRMLVNGVEVTSGYGRDALGGPLTAITWLVNTLSELNLTLRAGQFVTTGVTGKPSPVASGDRITVDLAAFGTVTATLV